MQMNRVASYVGVTVAMIVWSSSFIFTKQALVSFPPIMLVTMRISLAVLLLFIVGLVMRNLQTIGSMRDLLLFIAAGFAQPFGYFISEAYGLVHVSPTVASVVLSIIPIFTPLLAFVIIRERITWFNLVGLVISLSGVMMILLNKGDNLTMNFLGIVCLFGAVFCGILYAIGLKRVPERYSNISVIFYIHLFSLIFFIPTFFCVDVLGLFGEAYQFVKFDLSSSTIQHSLFAIFLLALFASVMSFIFFCKAVRDIGPTKANAFCNIMPACTALIMLFVFGEQLSWVKWVGIVVVMIGLFISQIRLNKNKY